MPQAALEAVAKLASCSRPEPCIRAARLLLRQCSTFGEPCSVRRARCAGCTYWLLWCSESWTLLMHNCRHDGRPCWNIVESAVTSY